MVHGTGAPRSRSRASRSYTPGSWGAPVVMTTATQRRAPLRAHAADRDDLDVRIARPLWERIEPGVYEAVGICYRKVKVFKAHKLVVEFDVLVPDPEAELSRRRVRLGRFYNVGVGPDRRVLAPPQGDYVRDWGLLTGRRPSRHDRLSPRVFIGVACKVEVATVAEDHRQDPLADFLQYSKIARILERLAGGGAL